jgi:uncharacterized protein (DUF885 family)
MLRRYTTLDRPPEEVYRLGQATVTKNTRWVLRQHRPSNVRASIVDVVQWIQSASNNRFASEEELITFSVATVGRARERSALLFYSLPERQVEVTAIPEQERGSGIGAYYRPSFVAAEAAQYRINPAIWHRETRGSAEVTAVHEAYPGHHIQISIAYRPGAPAVSRLLSNSAYVEGWGRYAEALAEEAGIYQTRYAAMTRRLWVARGMVADPGLHLFGWSRERVVGYLAESGRMSSTEASEIVDRMAAMPGQLTAYDSGGLEFLALRDLAKDQLGHRFDIRKFHQQVLEGGPLPLGALRRTVSDWVQAERRLK